MIYTEKSPIADAAGAKFGWPMCGAPESIVLDRGSAHISDDAYDILAYLGITNIGSPAGKPWLKPFIERIFRTIHSDLLLRFSGRAFSDIVEKGENECAPRALSTDEMREALGSAHRGKSLKKAFVSDTSTIRTMPQSRCTIRPKSITLRFCGGG